MWYNRWVWPTSAMQVWRKDRASLPQGVAIVLIIAVGTPVAVIFPAIGLSFGGTALIAIGLMDALFGGRDWAGHVSKRRMLVSVGLIVGGIIAIAARIIVW